MGLGGAASSTSTPAAVRSHSPSRRTQASRDDRSKRDRILTRRVGPLIQAGMTNVMALHGKLDMLKERAESATTTQYVLVVAKILATLKGVRIGSVCVCPIERECVRTFERERERACVCVCML
jgi:hypothetical protein